MTIPTGVIYRDDNLGRLSNAAEFPDESVDLIYLDPPFFSNRHYEVIWGDESEIRSFEDRWKGGIDHYIGWMEPRLEQMHRVLKPTGSIYLHCDFHANHHLRLALDRVFRPDRFRNELIWSYKRYTAASGRFQRLHDTILFYGKGKKGTFNDIREDYGERSGKADSHYKQDESGRWFRWQKRKGQDPYKVYLSEGRRLGDVWEIPIINASARERLGYPTQKPEALLQRIIEASSSRGDVVLDPFCGCGTAVAVAHKMKREWIGIDISPTAVGIIQDRLQIIGANVRIENGLNTVDDLRALKPLEFQNFIIKRVYGEHNLKRPEFGIDGFSFMEKLPIEVKQQEHVGREVVDKFETAIERHGSHKGYIIAFSFTKGAYAEAARIRGKGLEIALVEVQSLFDVARDIAPKPGLSQLESDLLHAVRVRLAVPELPKIKRPQVSVQELATSAAEDMG
jgi:DNA modification methylase